MPAYILTLLLPGSSFLYSLTWVLLSSRELDVPMPESRHNNLFKNPAISTVGRKDEEPFLVLAVSPLGAPEM